MLDKLNKESKYEIINHKLKFWQDKLEKSQKSIEFLNNHQDQLKIDMNNQDIVDIKAKIEALKQELDKIVV
jgi:uncharacterized protein YeeX (DUF496 family)